MSVQNAYPPVRLDSQRGAMLLEALIAILIFSFGVLGIVGLQGNMVKASTDANYRSEAAYIAQQRIGMIWADPGNAATYLENGTDISTLLPSGTRSVTQPAPNQFIVTVTWQQPGEGQHTYTTTAVVAGG